MSEPKQTESLKVIALISGGKDSFYSLLHCLRHGHEVVALANLYPPDAVSSGLEEEDEEDLNSFMYQTVGHTVIPLYEEALGIPLFREEIRGTAVESAATYGHGDGDGEWDDEVESLIPLLRRVMERFPGANALSTGAILSTYQRTRVESVALRLSLIPLGFLWQYPVLPPGKQVALLEDVEEVGLDARVIKVASGGLDESFLWENVGEGRVRRRVEKAMRRFGSEGDGAVLGEGGEFETLVIDGPGELFKGRIEIEEANRVVVRESGGAAWLRIKDARVVMKEKDEMPEEPRCRIPDLLDEKFGSILRVLNEEHQILKISTLPPPIITRPIQPNIKSTNDTYQWTFYPPNPANPFPRTKTPTSVSDQIKHLVSQVQTQLAERNLASSSITSTTILLRSMSDFTTINKTYSTLFPNPNPPSRVTISIGSLLLAHAHLAIHLSVSHTPLAERKGLHVQSRSYWAPANIGPYSQAISLPVHQGSEQRIVSIAGQIPLVPQSMTLPFEGGFELQAVLSLQHLWRIGIEMDVSWFSSIVAFLPSSTAASNERNARVAGKTWELLHLQPDEDDGEDVERDLWEEKHLASSHTYGSSTTPKTLPDFEHLTFSSGATSIPPFFAAEVEELPRAAGVEWHAHHGLTKGPVSIQPTVFGEGWVMHQMTFGERLLSVVMVYQTGEIGDFERSLREARGMLGGGSVSEASYFEKGVVGSEEVDEFGNGAIPCYRIWDAEGRRVDGVMLYDVLCGIPE